MVFQSQELSVHFDDSNIVVCITKLIIHPNELGRSQWTHINSVEVTWKIKVHLFPWNSLVHLFWSTAAKSCRRIVVKVFVASHLFFLYVCESHEKVYLRNLGERHKRTWMRNMTLGLAAFSMCKRCRHFGSLEIFVKMYRDQVSWRVNTINAYKCWKIHRTYLVVFPIKQSGSYVTLWEGVIQQAEDNRSRLMMII